MQENSGYLPHPMRENQMTFHFQVPRVESMPHGENTLADNIQEQNGYLQRPRRSQSGSRSSGGSNRYDRNGLHRRSYHGTVSKDDFFQKHSGNVVKKQKLLLSYSNGMKQTEDAASSPGNMTEFFGSNFQSKLR